MLFITPELKVLDKQRKQEYAKHGKTLKFFNLKSKFDRLYKKAAKDFLSKNVDQLRKCKPGRAHRTLHRMGARPGEDTDSSAFSIPEIRDWGLSDQEAANLIGDFFVRISQQHAPLDLDKVPLPVRDAIVTFSVEDIPLITPEQVKEVFASVAPSKAAVDGDILTHLYLKNVDILVSPISHLFRAIRAISVSPMLPAQSVRRLSSNGSFITSEQRLTGPITAG